MDYAGIIDRLREADAQDEAFDWLERAVADGRVSTHGGGRRYWLSPDEVAEAYVARGRTEDALEVQRTAFANRPEVPRFRALMARGAGRRTRGGAGRAMATLEELARVPTAVRLRWSQIALAERDVDAAWAAAEKNAPAMPGASWPVRWRRRTPAAPLRSTNRTSTSS